MKHSDNSTTFTHRLAPNKRDEAKQKRPLPFDRLNGFLSIAFAFLLLMLSQSILAEGTEEAPYNSFWLKTESNEDPRRYAATTLKTLVNIDISGPILRAKVKQTFRNHAQSWAEGIYSFPLPENAAVDTLSMIIGEQIIQGHIKEKSAAKRTYQQARRDGKRASLLNQHQANVFTTSVANIGPGDLIEIEFEYQQFVDFTDDTYSLRFPMVSTPKYTPPVAMAKPGFVSPINAIRAENEAPGNPIEFVISLDAGVPIEPPQSASHSLKLSPLSDTYYHINVEGKAAASNRDFLMSWQVQQTKEPLVSILTEQVDDDIFGLLMVVPPMIEDEFSLSSSAAAPVARELIFVLDVSGSMQGESILQAKSALISAVEKLREEDHFNLIWFNNHAWQLFSQSMPATREHIENALRKIESLDANGGTQMLPALKKALLTQTSASTKNEDAPSRLRQLVFMTDGAVGNEDPLFNAIETHLGNSRLFTVGIGSAPNSYFMRKAARAGRGSFTFISHPAEVEEKMSHLFEQLRSPSLTDIALDFQGYEVSLLPEPLPDLYLGEPLYAVFKADSFPEYVSLSGKLNGVPSWLRISLSEEQSHSGIAKEWGRRKIEQLLEQHRKASGDMKTALKDQVVQLAMDHHQVSPFTSLVAVDVTPVRAGGDLVSNRIPANRPKGWQQNTQKPNNIRLAQTATNAPFHIAAGVALLLLSMAGLRWPTKHSK